ncbi:MAG: hypothetical protein M0Q47_13245, partial [Methanothrix sp.]|uniref:hypothetical protein n=1 Tax=Methanothrix sp. TaxID=90426 RepID=UPI0025CF3564
RMTSAMSRRRHNQLDHGPASRFPILSSQIKASVRQKGGAREDNPAGTRKPLAHPSPNWLSSAHLPQV